MFPLLPRRKWRPENDFLSLDRVCRELIFFANGAVLNSRCEFLRGWKKTFLGIFLHFVGIPFFFVGQILFSLALSHSLSPLGIIVDTCLTDEFNCNRNQLFCDCHWYLSVFFCNYNNFEVMLGEKVFQKIVSFEKKIESCKFIFLWFFKDGNLFFYNF